ncbi:MAG: hypothetical protein KBT12_00275 [Bacteroidales bacterium]|nr:hypothetical protein [Candidatus Physcousia equi]
MKRIFTTLLCLASLVASAQEHQFTVATYNVDGLPASLNDPIFGIPIPINPRNPTPEKFYEMSERLNSIGWDIIGINEDFNYHEELMSGMTDNYNFTTFQGKMESSMEAVTGILAGTFRFPYDGLNLATKKDLKVTGEEIVPWSAEAVWGYLTNFQDSLTTKGFRFYTVEFPNGMAVDVIPLHADAGYEYGDRHARVNGMAQLYDFVVAHKSSHPMIILGDYNNLYARDDMKTLFMDRLNNCPGVTARDAWVEMKNGGAFPQFLNPADDDNDEKCDKLEEQRDANSEILDKIVYINLDESDCKLELVSVSNITDMKTSDGDDMSDHLPLTATFTLKSAATDIAGVYAKRADAQAYNLLGQPVRDNHRGVVIKNGRVVINK